MYTNSALLQKAVNAAHQSGIVVVAAAGNDNTTSKMYPAALDNVISVGSTGVNDEKSYFSNFGQSVDVSAPGSSILSTLPTYQISELSKEYGTLDGTSMASPLVAGLAALVKSANPDMSPIQITERIKATTDNIDAINADYAGKLGTGRINAHRALTGPALPINSIRITGATAGKTGESIKLAAIHEPSGATTPIKYMWEPEPISGQGSAEAIFKWGEAGPVQIKLTVTNEAGKQVIDVHDIRISDSRVRLESVSIEGETKAEVGAIVHLTAISYPADATDPLYRWVPEPLSGQNTSRASYKIDSVDGETIRVVVSNEISQVERTVTINGFVKPTPLESVSISGLTQIKRTGNARYHAVITPLDATAPVRYTWSPEPDEGQGTAFATYNNFDTIGTQNIRITVSAGGATKTASTPVNVVARTAKVRVIFDSFVNLGNECGANIYFMFGVNGTTQTFWKHQDDNAQGKNAYIMETTSSCGADYKFIKEFNGGIAESPYIEVEMSELDDLVIKVAMNEKDGYMRLVQQSSRSLRGLKGSSAPLWEHDSRYEDVGSRLVEDGPEHTVDHTMVDSGVRVDSGYFDQRYRIKYRLDVDWQ